jgi:hypothetical protein
VAVHWPSGLFGNVYGDDVGVWENVAWGDAGGALGERMERCV